jgi:hypothetical protein
MIRLHQLGAVVEMDFLPPPLLLSPLYLPYFFPCTFNMSASPELDPELVDKLIRLGLDAQTTSLMASESHWLYTRYHSHIHISRAVAFFALLVYEIRFES